ncbi:MAG: hypothetical protein VB861_03110 [Planctomycetaceae bacterium]
MPATAATAATAHSLPLPLQTAFGQLARRWRWLTVLHGIGLFLLTTTALLAAGVLLDLLLPLSTSLRILDLLLVGSGIAWAGYRLVLKRITAAISRAELAALVERLHPELEERLTSSVELLEANDQHGSDSLRLLLLEETTTAAQSVDFRQVLSLRNAAVMLAWAGVAAGLMFGPLAVPNSGHALLMTRFFVPWSNLGRTVLYRVSVEDGDRVVARGSDVHVRVRIEAPTALASKPTSSQADEQRPMAQPRNVWCRWTHPDGSTDRRLMERTADKTAYATTWPEVLRGFEFHVDADGSLSKLHTVRVVELPAVVGITLNVTPPPYTRLPTRTLDAVVGDVTVLAGSRLNWQLQFNKPIQHVRLKLLGKNLARPPTAFVGHIEADRRSATVQVDVETGGPLLVELTDQDGLSRDDSTYRRLVIQNDQPPTLALSGEDRPTAVRPRDSITVRAEADDDFGLASLELLLQVNPDTRERLQVDSQRLGGRNVVEHFTIDLSKFPLETGDRLTYRVRVTDTRLRPAPNETLSAPRVLLIDPNAQPPDLAQVVARQQEIRTRIELARNDSLQARSTLENNRELVLVALKQQTPFTHNDVIRKTSADLRELARSVDTIARLFRTQPLWQPLAPNTLHIARKLLPDTAARTETALDADLADKATRLAQADDQLAEVLDAFKQLLEDFDRIAELEQDLLELDRLAHRTNRLADDVESLASLAHDSDAGETPMELNQRRDEFQRRKTGLVKRHDTLEQQLDGLLEKRPEVLEAARHAQLARLRQLAIQAKELAVPQRELQAQLETETDLPPASTTKSTAPPVSAANPAAAPLARQQELARQATALALEIAAQLGPEADAARNAAQFARQAAGTARLLLAGRGHDATRLARTTATLADTAALALKQATRNEPGTKTDTGLIRRARELANRQNTDARMLAATANSAVGRQNIRNTGQQAIADVTQLVAQGLEQVAQHLASKPVQLPKHADQAQLALEQANIAQTNMESVRNHAENSQLQPAAQAAQQAADRLEQTARLALDAGDASARPETPVPQQVGEQVTHAVQTLKQSRQNLKQAQFDTPKNQAAQPGQKPGQKDGKPTGRTSGKKTGQQTDGKKTGQGKTGKSGKANGGKPRQSQQNQNLAQTAKQLRQAARSLANAAKNLKPAQDDPNQPAGPPGPNDPNSKDNAGNAGSGSSMASELKRLEAELARLSGRAWGRLPGALKTEILQAARRDPNGDYTRLIRFYFEEISRSNRNTQPTDTP